MSNAQNKQSAKQSNRADVEGQKLTGYRIEASIQNPETQTGADPHDCFIVEARAKANFHAKNFWRKGYWVEVYDNSTGELLAGAINPDCAFPSYIV